MENRDKTCEFYKKVVSRYNVLSALMKQYAEDKFINSDAKYISNFSIDIENNQIIGTVEIKDTEAVNIENEFTTHTITFDEFMDQLDEDFDAIF